MMGKVNKILLLSDKNDSYIAVKIAWFKIQGT